jgi:hypothetical protein
MKKYLLLFLFVIVCFAFQSNEEYITYCNDKYDYCIKYPTSFSMQEKSENGDGAFFISADKQAQVWAFGHLAIEDFDKLEQEYKITSDKIKVTYQVKRPTWFVFSGVDEKGNFIYQKTVKKTIEFYGDKNTPVFQTLRIAYPPDQKKQYDRYCKIIAGSFLD